MPQNIKIVQWDCSAPAFPGRGYWESDEQDRFQPPAVLVKWLRQQVFITNHNEQIHVQPLTFAQGWGQ